MQYNRLNNPNALIDALKALDKRVSNVETKGTGPIGFVGTDGVELHIGVQPDGEALIVPFVGDTTPPPIATAPLASAGVGTITVAWDGFFVDSAPKPADFQHLRVLGHKFSGGTYVLTVEVGMIRESLDVVYVGSDVASIDETWDFTFVSVDYNGNSSEQSAHSVLVTQSSFSTDEIISAAISSLSTGVSGAQSSADGKSTNYYEATAPTDVPVGKLQKGDTWFDTANGYRVSTWTGSAWQTTQDSALAQLTADAKGRTYTQNVAPPVEARLPQNLWIDTSAGVGLYVTKYWNGSAWTALKDADAKAAQDTADAKGETIYSSTEPAAAKRLSQNTWVDTTGGLNINKRWDGFAWVVVVDSRIPSTAAAVTAVDSRVTAVSAVAEAKGITYTQNTVPPVEARLPQNIWIDTSLGLDKAVTKYWNGSAWTTVSEKAASDAKAVADSKGETIYSSTAPDASKQLTQNTWVDTTGGINITKRWDGSGWVVAADSRIASTAVAVTAADAKAQDALDTADSKGVVYTQSTVPPVEARLPQNLWIDTSLGATQTVTKYWNGSAWTAVSEKAASDAQIAADAKGEIIYSTTAPAAAKQLPQNLWIDTNAGVNIPKRWNGSAWVAVTDKTATDAAAAASAAQTTANTAVTNAATAQGTANTATTIANGKNTSYYQTAQPTGGTYITGDLWFDTDDNYRLSTYTGSAWQTTQDAIAAKTQAIAAAATDATTKANEAQTAAISAAATDATTKVATKNATYYQTAMPTGGTYKVGDLWFDTDDGNKIYAYNGTTFVSAQDAAISAAQGTANTALTSANGKNKVYYQTAMPTGGTYILGDTWFDTDDGNKIYVHNGTTFVASQDSGISLSMFGAFPSEVDTAAANKWLFTKYSKTTVAGTRPAYSDVIGLTGTTSLVSDGATLVQASGDNYIGQLRTIVNVVSSKTVTVTATHDDGARVYVDGVSVYSASAYTQNVIISFTLSAGTHVIDLMWAEQAGGDGWYSISPSFGSQMTSMYAPVLVGQTNTTANTALTTANLKTKTYFQTDSPGTSGNTVGDTWFDTDDGNKVYVWNGSAWTVAQDAAISAAQTSANGKNTIFYQTAAPPTTGRVTGDTWFDTDDGNKIYVWNGSAWTASQDAAIAAAQTTANTANTAAGAAQTTANSKTKTFIQGTAPTATTVGDIWIDTANGNVIKTWEGSSWVTRSDAAIAAAQTAANTAQTSANGKATVFYQAAAPATSGRVTGDTWFDIDDGNKIYVWNGSAWTLSQDAAIATAQSAANTAQTAANAAQTTANSKVKTFVQGTAPTATTTGDIWIDTATGNAIKVWDGSAWVNRADTAIAAAQTAANNAQTSANGRNRIYYQTTMPSGGTYIAGDTWFDTDDGNKIYVHNGTTFTASQLGTNAIANLAITDAQIASATISNAKIANLDAAKITTGTLDANRIGANTITANKIFVGDFTNLAADGNFTDTAKLSWTGSGSVMVSAGQPNRLRVITASSGNNDQPNVNIFQVEAGEQVYVDALVYGEPTNVGGGNPNIHLAVNLHDGTTAWPGISLTRAGVQGAWTPLQGTITIPTNGKTAKVELAVTYSADAVGNTYYFREVTVRRKATGSLIVDGAIQAGSAIIATGAIGTAQIGNLAVGTAQIADTAITTAKIANLAVTNAHIADATIASAKIANLDAAKITTGTLDANRIGADTITATHIASDSITSNELAAGSITAAKGQISNLAVGTAQIQDTAITTAKIANLAVTDAQIASATITSAKIANLDAAKITTGTLDANRIGADTITASHIASDAITVNELAANSITAAKGQISDAAITTAKIADAQITTAKIANLAVDNAKIADATIQYAKIGSVDAATISVGTLSANRIGANTITSSKMLISDMEELIPNPFFHPNGEPVTSGSVVAATSTPVSAGAPFPYVHQFSTRDNHPFINTPNIAVKAGDQFYLEVWVASSTSIRNFNLYMFRSMVPVGGLTATTSTGNIAPTSTWTKVTWDYTVPADGYNYIKPVLQINNSGGETTAQMTWYATGWTMKRKNTGKLIVDGAIQAGSAIIADAAIGNAKIADLNADKLTAGTVNAARLNAEDIRAKVISATNIDAVDIINTGTLTSASGLFGTMNASVINAGTFAADRIGANTIDVSKLNVTMGGLNLIANSSFEVDSDSNGIADGWTVSTRSTGDAGRVFTNSLVAGHFPGSTWAQKVVTTTATNTNSSSLQGTQLFPVAPGVKVTVSLYARANSAQNFAIGMRCEDDAAAYIGEPTFTAALTTTVQRFSGTLTIPAGTTKAKFTITGPTSPANGSWFEADGVKVEIGDVVSAWSPMTQELLPGTILANMISATAIDGKTITGATVQSEATANRGIKLTSAELAGYDGTGIKNFSLSSAGVLTLKGAIQSGSTITGATLTGAGIETTATAARGVKIASTGITTYDGSGNMTFKVDAATGLVEAPGIKANSIKGDRIESGTVTADKLIVGDFSNLATIDELNGITITSYGQTQIVSGYNSLVTDSGSFFMFTNQRGPVPFKLNDTLYFEFTAKATSATTANFGAWTYNAGGSNLSSISSALNIGTTDTLVKGQLVVSSYIADAKQFVVGLSSVANKGIQVKGVKVYKKYGGELIVDGAIDGKVITGATIQTEATVNRGIKLTSTELSGYDGAGIKNLSLTSAGVLTLKGDIQSGSTITGARLIGAGIETSATASSGVKIASTGITAYDASNNLTFKVDAATGLVEAPGLKANSISSTMISATAIDGKTITGATVQTEATVSRGIKLTSTEFAGYDSAGVKNFSLLSDGTLSIKGAITSGSTITGATVTGSTIQTEATADRGIKLTSAELSGFDGAGIKNLSLTSAGALTLRGEIKSGSTIEGARITGTQGLETSTVANTGVKINNVGIKAYDSGNNLTFHLDATTGMLEVPGLKANSITGDKIATDAITAKHLSIGDFTNLAYGGEFNSADDVANWTLETGVSYTTSAPQSGAGCLVSTANASSRSAYLNTTVSVQPLDQFQIEFWYKTSSDFNGTSTNSKFRIGDQTGAHLQSTTFQTVSTSWTKLTASYTVPSSGVTGLKLSVVFDHTVGSAWIDNVVFRKRVGTTLIENGAITTGHMTSGTIDAGILVAGSIKALQIGSKAITADKLVITSTDNLVQEGTFNAAGISWELPSGFAVNNTAGRNSTPAMVITNTASLQTSYNAVGDPTKVPIEVQSNGGAAYRVIGWVNASSSVPASGAYITTRFLSSTGSTSVSSVYAPGTLAANTWTEMSGVVVAPPNTISIAFSINSSAEISTGTLKWDMVSATRAATGSLIVDGAIDGKTITGAEIKTNPDPETEVYAQMGQYMVSDFGTEDRPGFGFINPNSSSPKIGMFSEDGSNLILMGSRAIINGPAESYIILHKYNSDLYNYQVVNIIAKETNVNSMVNIVAGGEINIDAPSVKVNGNPIQEAWQSITLAGSWVNYTGGGGYIGGLRARRIGTNVQIQGMVKNGSGTIATLPTDLWPQFSSIRPVIAAGAAASIGISNAGVISYLTGTAAPSYVSINEILPL